MLGELLGKLCCMPVYILPLNVRRRTVARKIFPVFYNIDPSEVVSQRWDTEAFHKHEI